MRRAVAARSGDPALGQVRECPACTHPHAVGTTCRECLTCRATDPVLLAEATFGDLLPGGTDAQAALVRHNESLRHRGRCDADCGVPDCRAPYYDQAGLTTYLRPTATKGGTGDDACVDRKKEVRDDSTTSKPHPCRPVFGQPVQAREGD